MSDYSVTESVTEFHFLWLSAWRRAVLVNCGLADIRNSVAGNRDHPALISRIPLGMRKPSHRYEGSQPEQMDRSGPPSMDPGRSCNCGVLSTRTGPTAIFRASPSTTLTLRQCLWTATKRYGLELPITESSAPAALMSITLEVQM